MSREIFDDNCTGCRPVLIDTKTRKPFSADSPQMKAVMGAWAETTIEERAAFHNMTCLNSRDLKDTSLALRAVKRIEGALQKLRSTSLT